MDPTAKSAIKSLVLRLRHDLEDDLAIQLKRYGFAGERWLDVETLPHIYHDDDEMAIYQHLRPALEQHLRRIGVRQVGAEPEDATPKQRAEAVDWFVREMAFTHLNRLVALKCLEVRGLIEEIITTRDAYGGRSRVHYDYRAAHPEVASQRDDGLTGAIRHACRRVYADMHLRFLFDVGDPAVNRDPPANTLLWPSPQILRDSIARINGLDAQAGHEGRTLWAEDEILGWLYQFYNAEHKEAVRDRGRPRRPAEVAVINQFFTPRWIVKFLVDNTLGRLWLEMHPDSERVRALCDYLVPEPLGTGEGDGGSGSGGEVRLDPASPINTPRAEARRKPKKPQALRLIDPACGTMHFGHYAFEVFTAIYQDARDRTWVTGDDALPDAEIPGAILANNLYGVDIDLRAVQLAALSLVIKARTANPDAVIDRVNLVVADAVLPEDGARTEFLAQYADNRKVQDAVRQVLAEMENVAEVGSLLRVEERLRDLLVEAGAQVEGLEPAQGRLPGTEPEKRQLGLYEAGGARPEDWGAHYTMERVLKDIRFFATQALRVNDLNAHIFAQEAEKSIHLLDVLLTDYDVAVMNPPYGDTTDAAKRHLDKTYPDTKNDLYAAFIERGLELVSFGYLGALVSRTFMYLSTFESFRRKVLLAKSEIISIAEMGLGVLDDATVRPSAVVLGTDPAEVSQGAVFYRLPQVEVDEKAAVLSTALKDIAWGIREGVVFTSQPRRFASLPKSPFTYWVSEQLLQTFISLPPLDKDNLRNQDDRPKIADVKEGLGTRDDARFVRSRWEIPESSIGTRWYPFVKGGRCQRYYKDVDLVVDWGDDGSAIKQNIIEKYPYLNGDYGWLVKSTSFYFQEGTTYTRESEKATLGVYRMPAGCIFSDKGPAIFFASQADLWWGMGILDSTLIAGFLRMLTPDRSRPIGLVSSFPMRIPNADMKESLSSAVRKDYDLKSAWDTGNETATSFSEPWILQTSRMISDQTDRGKSGISQVFSLLELSLQLPSSPGVQTLSDLLDFIVTLEKEADSILKRLQDRIDEIVYSVYSVNLNDRALIERELGDPPPEIVWPHMERESDEEKRREHIRRLLSYFVLEALKETRDGILPLCEGTGHPTALDAVRSGLAETFGEEAAFRMEGEIAEILGRDIGDWLDGPFIKWHTSLYKSRPILWQLSSRDYYHTFNIFLYIHKLDADTLRKVQTQYLWPKRRTLASARDAAQADEDYGRLEDVESDLEALEAFEVKLLSVIEGEVTVRTPSWAEGPYRHGIYDPVLDDGVKVNIAPLQKAYLLRYKRMV